MCRRRCQIRRSCRRTNQITFMNNNQTKPLVFCAEINSLYFKGLWLVAFAFVFVAQVQASPTAFGAFPNNSTHSSAAVAQAIANVPTNVGTIYDASGQTNDIQIWNFNTLLYTGSTTSPPP